MGTVTIGTDTYEIYGEQTEAESYLSASLSAAEWNALTTDDKARTLVMATRYFDRTDWLGDKTVDSQPIEWPRDNTGVSDDGTTPQEIYNGFWEMASQIAKDNEVTNNQTTGSNTSRVKAGEAEVWFFRNTQDSSSKYPVDVLDWIKPYLDGSDAVALSAATGVDDDFESVFDSPPCRTGGVY